MCCRELVVITLWQAHGHPESHLTLNASALEENFECSRTSSVALTISPSADQLSRLAPSQHRGGGVIPDSPNQDTGDAGKPPGKLAHEHKARDANIRNEAGGAHQIKSQKTPQQRPEAL